ncbi:MAG TPA: ABC transporter substrate-binding protein [Acidimicrobiales bacterium]|nr:ABC transporter substrate-binding protein [Acidimicrobiales bacterium]
MTRTISLRRGVLVGTAALALVLAACGSDNKGSSSATTSGGGAATSAGGGAATSAGGGAVDIKGKTVKILGTEVAGEADGVTNSFKPWEQQTGAKLNYTGTRDAETQVRTAAEAGGSALPDIFFAPQPGLVRDLAKSITPVPQDLVTKMKSDLDPYLVTLGTVNNQVLGVPVKADLKSLVWYSPKVFKQHNYQIPQTWDAMLKLGDQMKKDGITPWCVGIESGDATGWPMTDWMEDVMLRLNGPDVYDKWTNHQIPFNDPQVKAAAQMVADIWFTQGNVVGGRQAIASTAFANAGLPILDGGCGMYRMSNFYGSNFTQSQPNTTFGDNGDVNVFYLPTISDKFGKVTEIAGLYAVAFNSKPETMSALAYLESADYANTRAKVQASGFLSPNKNIDVNSYGNPLDKQLATILKNASPVRFDASDAMPAVVGAGTFWKEGTNWVNGTESLDTFLNNVEASWPKS